VITLSPEASEQLDALERFYIAKRRPQALRNLGHALAEASLLILNSPERGRPFPRPYPELESVGLSWIKRGRYWIAYDPAGPVIAGVFFEADDIPTRVRG
jgi:plasmid stabilization system protein ParE